MRYVLHKLPYANKDLANIGTLDTLLVGRAHIVYERGEHPVVRICPPTGPPPPRFPRKTRTNSNNGVRCGNRQSELEIELLHEKIDRMKERELLALT